MSHHEETRDSRWWLPREEWNKLSPEQRFEHCVNVNAYFRSESRKRQGLQPNDVQDRLLAESEIKEMVKHNRAIIDAY